MKNKVLVTGGAGFIGSHLTKKLLIEGFEVIVYDNFVNASGRKNIPTSARIIRGSILNYSRMKTCFKNSKIIFNLAVLPLGMSFDIPEKVMKVNDFGSYLVTKVCTEMKIKLVHISSSEAYGDGVFFPMKENHPLLPTTVYAASKSSSESYVRAWGETHDLNYVIIRPFNSYGEFMREDSYAAAIPKFYSRISKNKNPIIFGSGNQTRDLTYVEDTVNGIFIASQESNAIGRTFNIAQGKETKIKNLARIMIKKFSEISGKNLDLDLVFRKKRPGDVQRHLGDTLLSKNILGYRSTVDLEDGIEKYIKWRMNKGIKK